MAEWTQAASDSLRDYLDQTRTSLEHSDADVDEVIDDIQRHVEEEIQSAGLSIVSETDIQQILSRLGPLESPALTLNKSSVDPGIVKKPKKLSAFFFITFGCVLPCFTVINHQKK